MGAVYGEKLYSFAKYQAADDDELSASFEQHMLLAIKRDSVTSVEDGDGGNAENREILLSSQLGFGEDPTSDSSDDDMSTFKSPKYFPKHRPSYDYNAEIANLGRRFLGTLNVTEWESPRIVSSTAALNSSRDMDTMDIPHATLEAPTRPTVYQSQNNAASGGNESDEELDLLYDPQLQCFYDPRTVNTTN